MPTMAVNGYHLHYLDQGAGTPVVLEHGLCMDHTMFAAQVEALAERYRVIVPDLRGHGQTTGGAGDYAMEDQADDLYHLLTCLGIKSAHIGGMSMGGMIALRFGLAHPELTRSLLLIDTDAGPEHPTRQEQYEALAGTFLAGAGAQVVDLVMRILFAAPFFTNLPEQAAHWRQKILDLPPQGLLHATRCVTRRTDVRDRLGELKMPALIICGEDDIATTPDKSRAMAERLSRAELVMVPEAGHSSPVEQPAAVTNAIVRFLDRISDRA